MQSAPPRPLFVRSAALCLSVLHKLLPKSAYDGIYSSLFPRYKARQRIQYRKKAIRRAGADIHKTETVFKCMEHSLVGAEGLEATYDKTKEILVKAVPGDLVECGVAQGGGALLIGLVAREFGGSGRQLWLFDSFEGLPDPTELDFQNGKTGTHVRPLPKGSCLGTIEEVSNLLFKQNGLNPSSIHLVKGWFQDTLPTSRDKIGPIALLRLDGDWYESTKTCLENLFDQVSAGGYVILDDYFSCFGCQKATSEFLAERGKTYPIVPDGRGGAYFQKTR